MIFTNYWSIDTVDWYICVYVWRDWVAPFTQFFARTHGASITDTLGATLCLSWYGCFHLWNG